MKCTYGRVSGSFQNIHEGDSYLGARAGKIRTEHDDPGRGVRELLAASLETVLEEFEVSTTTVAALLVLDLVLNNQRLLLEVDRFLEGCRDSVMGGLALGYETLVALNEGAGRVLDRPFADIAERLAAYGGLLRCLRRRPSARPVVGELLEERSLDRGGLMYDSR